MTIKHLVTWESNGRDFSQKFNSKQEAKEFICKLQDDMFQYFGIKNDYIAIQEVKEFDPNVRMLIKGMFIGICLVIYIYGIWQLQLFFHSSLIK